MATTQDIIKATASTLHQLHLKPLRFRKSGNTWVRPTEWPQVINVQLSKRNPLTEAQFTVNLGISIEELHDASEGLPFKGSLKEYDCDVRTRIGELFPSKKDKWWQVTPSTDSDKLADDVFAQIEQFGVPWLNRLNNYSEVAQEFIGRKSLFMAALAWKLAGDSVSAERAMAEAHSQSNSHSLLKLERLAAKHEILIKR